MIDGHFVWIWIDTTTKPASFLTLPASPNQNLTQKFTRYLEKPSKVKNKDNFDYQKDGVNVDANSSAKSFDEFKKNGSEDAKKMNKVELRLKNVKKTRRRRYANRNKGSSVSDKKKEELMVLENSVSTVVATNNTNENDSRQNNAHPKQNKTRNGRDVTVFPDRSNSTHNKSGMIQQTTVTGIFFFFWLLEIF